MMGYKSDSCGGILATIPTGHETAVQVSELDCQLVLCEIGPNKTRCIEGQREKKDHYSIWTLNILDRKAVLISDTELVLDNLEIPSLNRKITIGGNQQPKFHGYLAFVAVQDQIKIGKELLVRNANSLHVGSLFNGVREGLCPDEAHTVIMDAEMKFTNQKNSHFGFCFNSKSAYPTEGTIYHW